MHYQKPNRLLYRVVQGLSGLLAAVVFQRKFLRNEIAGKEGPFVVLANHQAALDFVNLIGATSRPMHFVISQSFFTTLPFQGLLKHMGLIPKQQFQTSVGDLKQMKTVIEHGQPLVIYPAGLMCEDGLSTPIPSATYKFIKWMDADIYAARIRGSYFVSPKWGKGFRPGRTTMDIYKLFSREELHTLSLDQIRARADAALLYDAYREQEDMQVRYRNNHMIAGLEQVLYRCPQCDREFTIALQGKDSLVCRECGFTAKSDAYGFLTTNAKPLRYVSDWSRKIYDREKQLLLEQPGNILSCKTAIFTVDPHSHKFVSTGEGVLQLGTGGICLEGTLHGEAFSLSQAAGAVPTLPFKPGKYLELQDGNTIYRCVLEDGRLTMQFINRIKILYEVKRQEKAPV